MSNDLGADTRILDIAGNISTGNRASRLTNRFVAARVIAIVFRVDDVTNGSVGNGADGCQDSVRQGRILGIDNQHAVLVGLDRDIPAGPHQHINVALHRQHMDLNAREVFLSNCEACKEE